MSASYIPLTFDAPYAILNLDWMTALITAREDTPRAKPSYLIASNGTMQSTRCKTALQPFLPASLNPNEPEVQPDSPFAKLIASYIKFTTGSHRVQIYKRWRIDKSDMVLQKTRWSATAESPLEQILRAKGIKSVLVSGLGLSGVVTATVYRLFDLDYNVYVIRENVSELPLEQMAEVAHVMMDILLPKMALSVISLEEAIEALRRS
ncbi:cysteine hydrolase family protein [Aspergillus nidulans var. acristatus]